MNGKEGHPFVNGKEGHPFVNGKDGERRSRRQRWDSSRDLLAWVGTHPSPSRAGGSWGVEALHSRAESCPKDSRSLAWGLTNTTHDPEFDVTQESHNPLSSSASGASDESETELSHVVQGRRGAESRMVDVGGKPHTDREAVAEACVRFPAGLLELILAEGGPKGPVTEIARAAGVLAAKRTGDLIPMCHPLGLDAIDLHFETLEGEPDVLRVVCRSACHGPTGVEMEALTGASIAALTIYDMTKALTKGIEIERVRLLSKKGGKSGEWMA